MWASAEVKHFKKALLASVAVSLVSPIFKPYQRHRNNIFLLSFQTHIERSYLGSFVFVALLLIYNQPQY